MDGDLGRDYGIYIDTIDYVTVDGFIVQNHSSVGIFFISSSNGIIYNNTCYSNDGTGIALILGSNATVYNNICYSNSIAGILVISNLNVIVKNNIIWNSVGNCLYVDSVGQTGFVSDYNDLYATGTAKVGYWGADRTTLAAWQTASGQDANSISADPLFKIAGSDFHLEITSLCVNKGTNLSPTVTTDKDGRARPQMSLYDIGAYEVIAWRENLRCNSKYW